MDDRTVDLLVAAIRGLVCDCNDPECEQGSHSLPWATERALDDLEEYRARKNQDGDKIL